MTAPSALFDLENFAHKAIFEGCVHVWEVLPKIRSYLESQTLGQHKGIISPQAYLINPELITVEEGAIVEAGAYIQGPCIIGAGSTVRHGAYIRGDVITGKKVIIGHTTEVKNAIFLDGAHAAHFAYVGDSILGARVNLGAGVKCANFRLDQRNISVRFAGQKYATGMRKLGAIIGDGSQIGCNSVINPGRLLSRETMVAPCTNV